MLNIPKKGDLNLKSNYRQVSILPVVSKVFERIMLKQINKYMDNIFWVDTKKTTVASIHYYVL